MQGLLPQRASLLALVLLGTVAAQGCGGGGDGATAARQAPACERPEASWTGGSLNAPRQRIEPRDDWVAEVGTSCGTFEIDLDEKRSPKVVNSLVILAHVGFYEGLPFDRMVPGRIVAGGDPPGKGLRGPGYTVEERPPAGVVYTRGTVAMAKRPGDPAGTSGSEFFVVLAPRAKLPPEYAVLGRVDRGMDVIDLIGEQGSPSGKPKRPVLIEWIWAKKRR